MNSPNPVENTREIASANSSGEDISALNPERLKENGYDWLIESLRCQEVVACLLEPELINRSGVDKHSHGDLTRSRLHVFNEKEVAVALRELEKRKWVEKHGKFYSLTRNAKRELGQEDLTHLMEEVTLRLQAEREQAQQMSDGFRTKLILDNHAAFEPYLRAVCIMHERDPSQLSSNRLKAHIKIELRSMRSLQNKLSALGFIRGDNIPTETSLAWYSEYCVNKTLPDFSKTSKKAKTTKKTAGRFHSHATFPDTVGKLLRDDLLSEVVALFHFAKDFGIAKRLAECTRTELAAELPDILTPHLAALTVTGLDELGVVKDITRTHFRYVPAVVNDFIAEHPRSRQRLLEAKERLSKRLADFHALSTEEQVEYMLKNQGTARAVLDKIVAHDLVHGKRIDRGTLADSVEISAGNVKRQISLLTSLGLIDKKERPLPNAKAWYKRFVDPNADVEVENVLDTGIVEAPVSDVPQELARPEAPVVVENEQPLVAEAELSVEESAVEEILSDLEYSAPESLDENRKTEGANLQEPEQPAVGFDLEKAVETLRDERVAEMFVLVSDPSYPVNDNDVVRNKLILLQRPHLYRQRDVTELMTALRQIGILNYTPPEYRLSESHVSLVMESEEGRGLIEKAKLRIEADNAYMISLPDDQRIQKICEVHNKIRMMLHWAVENSDRIGTRAGEKELLRSMKTSIQQLRHYRDLSTALGFLDKTGRPTDAAVEWHQGVFDSGEEQNDVERVLPSETSAATPTAEILPEKMDRVVAPAMPTASEVKKKLLNQLKKIQSLSGPEANEIAISGDRVTIRAGRLHKNIRLFFELLENSQQSAGVRSIARSPLPLEQRLPNQDADAVIRLLHAMQVIDNVSPESRFRQKPELVHYITQLEELGRMERAFISSEKWRNDRFHELNQELSQVFLGGYTLNRDAEAAKSPLAALGDLIQALQENKRDNILTAFVLHSFELDTFTPQQGSNAHKLLRICNSIGLSIRNVGSVARSTGSAHSLDIDAATLVSLENGDPIDIYSDGTVLIYPELTEGGCALRAAQIELSDINMTERLIPALKKFLALENKFMSELIERSARTASEPMRKTPYDGFSSDADHLLPQLNSYTVTDGLLGEGKELALAIYSFRISRPDYTSLWYPTDPTCYTPESRSSYNKLVREQLTKVNKLNLQQLDKLAARIEPTAIVMSYSDRKRSESYTASDALRDVTTLTSRGRGRTIVQGEVLGEVARLLDRRVSPSLVRPFLLSADPFRKVKNSLRNAEHFDRLEKTLLDMETSSDFILNEIEMSYEGEMTLRGKLPYQVTPEEQKAPSDRTPLAVRRTKDLLATRHRRRKQILRDLSQSSSMIETNGRPVIDILSPGVDQYMSFLTQLEGEFVSGRLSQHDLYRTKRRYASRFLESAIRDRRHRGMPRDRTQISSFQLEVLKVATEIYGEKIDRREFEGVAKLIRGMRFLDIPRHRIVKLDKSYRYPFSDTADELQLAEPYRYAEHVTAPRYDFETQVVCAAAPKRIDTQVEIAPQGFQLEISWGKDTNALFPKIITLRLAPDFNASDVLQELAGIHSVCHELSQRTNYIVQEAGKRPLKKNVTKGLGPVRQNDTITTTFNPQLFLGGRQLVTHPHSSLLMPQKSSQGVDWLLDLRQGIFSPLVSVQGIFIPEGSSPESQQEYQRQIRIQLEAVMDANNQMIYRHSHTWSSRR